MSANSAHTTRKRSADDMASTGQATIDQMFRRKAIKRDKKTSDVEISKDSHASSEHFSKTPSKSSKPSHSSKHHQAPLQSSSPAASTLTVTEHAGDIFSAPSNTVLVHACNCQGSWSAGIAKAFKTHYPAAFKKYAAHCERWSADELLGTALLIPPASFSAAAADTKGNEGGKNATSTKGKANGMVESGEKGSHFVGCLFTSAHYGKRKGSPKQILEATGPAMEDLLRKINAWNEDHPIQSKDDDDNGKNAKVIGENMRSGVVRMCKINSGLFNVPWEDTKAVIEGLQFEEGGAGDGDVVKEIQVWER